MEVKGVRKGRDAFSVEVTPSHEHGVFISRRDNEQSVVGKLAVVHGISEVDAARIEHGDTSALDSYIVPSETVPGTYDLAEDVHVSIRTSDHSSSNITNPLGEFVPYQPAPVEV